jgi:hypothetical protein
MCLLLSLGLTSVIVCASALGANQPVRGGPIPPRVPALQNAAALGVLVRLDAARGFAEFRISCGWYYSPKKKVRAGLWKVDLRHLTFGEESNPANPGAGHVNTVSRKSWEHWSALRGWSGTLRLREPGGFLSNGPTTDICAGILG